MDQNEYVTVAAVTPNPKIQNAQVDNFMGHSETKQNTQYVPCYPDYFRNHQKYNSVGDYNRGATTQKSQMSRNSSMSHLCKTNNGASLRNIAHKHSVTRQRNPSTYRRKSYGALKMNSGAFKVPTVMHMQTVSSSQKVKKTLKHGAGKFRAKYGSILQQSTSKPREPSGEYSYGKGGASFAKTVKKSKFDEDKERIYSPGPGRYESRTNGHSSKYSFTRQKKDFSFVQRGAEEIPSPGKYKIKRDFLSRTHRRSQA